MVRTTIACAWCRRSKIKCIHAGEPPCRNCLKSNREGCVLSGPFDPGQPAGKAHTPVTPSSSVQRRNAVFHSIDTETLRQRAHSHHGFEGENDETKTPMEIILAMSPQLTLEVATVFNQKFPELAFLHLPTLLSRSNEDATMWVQIAAMCALCCRLLTRTTQDRLVPEEKFYSYAREGLQSVRSGPPSLPSVQALLIMSMYEWGAGNGYAAWMDSGMAIRMMQSLDAMKTKRDQPEIDGEIYNRTFWACFVMDRFIFCGKSQPRALPLERMPIQVPIGEEDFAFGVSGHAGRSISTSDPFTNNEYSAVLVGGFEIWSKVLDLIISGGRRKPNMSRPENCPWVKGSPWKTLIDGVEDWRSQQSDRLKFPSTSVAVHVSLGYGEKFAYVNLLYYVCVLFLNREYIPFLPIQLSEPIGPIDPPLLEATAPPGWWHDRAKDLYDAAEYITAIHQQLELLNVPLFTPFAAFCTFCAGSMNGYATSFPHMNLNRSPNSAANEELNFLYLEKFRGIWKMGDGWIQTLKRVQNLRLCVTQDRARFQGKTRSDFVALDESIHDFAGVTPPARVELELSELSSRSPIITTKGPSHTSTLSSRELPSIGHIRPNATFISVDLDSEVDFADIENWNQAWPMWGDQQSLPFDINGVPFQFDPNLPTF
ncbi:putative fungal-specific transcription factor [Rhexocercosporidium sp. MPI-PUGE-AT-0058]|nr:putative fungal-specific transcription factor [Rhexocercosporidium sp. MPI-PUGE-AT-0058]